MACTPCFASTGEALAGAGAVSFCGTSFHSGLPSAAGAGGGGAESATGDPAATTTTRCASSWASSGDPPIKIGERRRGVDFRVASVCVPVTARNSSCAAGTPKYLVRCEAGAGLTDNSVRLWFAVFISVGTRAEYSWGGMVDGHLGEGEKVWLGARERMLAWRSGCLPGGRRFVRHGVPHCPPAPVPAASGMGMGRVCLTSYPVVDAWSQSMCQQFNVIGQYTSRSSSHGNTGDSR
jgi:hypothetical protein